MQIYCVRHGESESNVKKIISNRGLQHGLTPQGIEQVNQLAQRLKEVPVAALYSSPLLRAAQSSEILARQFDVKATPADALREFDCGDLEGKSDAGSHKLLYEIWDDWMLHGNWPRQFEGGDSYETIRERFMRFFSLLGKHAHQTVMLVGHGGTFRAMLPLIADNIDHAFAHEHWISNAGYVAITLSDSKWICTRWGDVNLG